MTRLRSGLLLGACALVLVGLLAGCGRDRVNFNYPGETLVFPNSGEPPTVFVAFVNDLRSEHQRAGEGSSSDTRFPSDEEWARPVTQIYYEALVQDLSQTNAVYVSDTPAHADYHLQVDLLNLGCAVKRSTTGWLGSALLGAGAGWALSQSVGAALAGAVVGVGAIPVPTRVRAVCQVRLRLTGPEGERVFEETCLGELTGSGWESMTARRDQEWVDEYLTVAVKRCNACLVGQLRQAVVEHHGEARGTR
jgi:hypothetical protein